MYTYVYILHIYIHASNNIYPFFYLAAVWTYAKFNILFSTNESENNKLGIFESAESQKSLKQRFISMITMVLPQVKNVTDGINQELCS